VLFAILTSTCQSFLIQDITRKKFEMTHNQRVPAPVLATLVMALVFCGLTTTSLEGQGPAERFEVFVLGFAQDGGVPHLGCDKVCCTEARRLEQVNYPTCLGIRDMLHNRLLLIEATPMIEAQVALFHELTNQGNRGRRPVDAILLTHAHIGHYLGLAELGREVTATNKLPVHVSPRMGEFLRSNGPWNQLVELEQIELVEFEPFKEFELWPGLHVMPIQVPHRDEYSDTMAFKIRGPRETLLFVPDVDSWFKDTSILNQLLEGVTIAYMDGTFFDGREVPDRDPSEIPHPPMVDTMGRLNMWIQEHPDRLRFIHLNHTNPALRNPNIRDGIKRRGFAVAERGERVTL
jgi:pyrroloquinoline quinone biosynthesis protein B